MKKVEHFFCVKCSVQSNFGFRFGLDWVNIFGDGSCLTLSVPKLCFCN